MQDFAFGVLVGQLSIMLVVAILLHSNRERLQKYVGSHRRKRPKKVDGIWTVREDRPRNPVDPSRTRVRRAVILERTRRG